MPRYYYNLINECSKGISEDLSDMSQGVGFGSGENEEDILNSSDKNSGDSSELNEASDSGTSNMQDNSAESNDFSSSSDDEGNLEYSLDEEEDSHNLLFIVSFLIRKNIIRQPKINVITINVIPYCIKFKVDCNDFSVFLI